MKLSSYGVQNLLAIDANIFIELLLKQERYEQSKEFLKKVCEGEIKAVVSNFTISGICIVLERNGKNWKDIRTFLLSILAYKGLSVYQEKMYDKIIATTHMRDYKLDFEDCITLQCALACKCDSLVSFDSDFDKIKCIRRVKPVDVI